MKDIVDMFKDENKYKMPHKFSFITLEEFCELNNIRESELTDDQIKFFYDNYGCSKGLPASIYDASHTHNDWVVENFKSHDYKIVVNRLRKLLGDNIIVVNTDQLSEKYTSARIIKIVLKKDCDIFNADSAETFKLNNSELSNKINDILNFHNYYLTLIYFYDRSNVIILEPKQTKDASDFVKQSKYVYHITYKDNLQNILKKGLRPKAKKTQEDSIYRYYTDRVFLIVDSPNIKKDLVNVIQDLGYNPFSEDYVILKIDVSKLNITYWWDDASGGETVYTIESIPPKFIKVIGNVMNFDS